jgi:hypothetical protein
MLQTPPSCERFVQAGAAVPTRKSQPFSRASSPPTFGTCGTRHHQAVCIRCLGRGRQAAETALTRLFNTSTCPVCQEMLRTRSTDKPVYTISALAGSKAQIHASACSQPTAMVGKGQTSPTRTEKSKAWLTLGRYGEECACHSYSGVSPSPPSRYTAT